MESNFEQLVCVCVCVCVGGGGGGGGGVRHYDSTSDGCCLDNQDYWLLIKTYSSFRKLLLCSGKI